MEHCPKCKQILNADEKASGKCFSCGASFESSLPKDTNYYSYDTTSSNANNTIPKSLKECYETDRVSRNIQSWSDWLDIWGNRILGILIVIGIIFTIKDAIEIADIDEDLVIFTVITSIMTWALYAFLEYCAFNILSLLVASLATIVQNSKITANVALYNAAKSEQLLNESKNSSNTLTNEKQAELSWICNNCGKMRTKSPCPYCNNE